MAHEYNIPFETFERYSLALSIIAKQRELMSIQDSENVGYKEVLQSGIDLMIEKLITESTGIEEMILKTK